MNSKSKLLRKLTVIAISILLLGGILGAIIGILFDYFNFVSMEVDKASSSHLSEVYGQVNKRFSDYIDNNWDSLNDWSHHLTGFPDETPMFVQRQQKIKGFSHFYFLAKNGDSISIDKDGNEVKGRLPIDDVRDDLFENRSKVMTKATETLQNGTTATVTVFAVPIPLDGAKPIYKGFEYGAVGLCYSNQAIVETLKITAFSEQSAFYIVTEGGNIILTSKAGGSTGNRFAYIKNGKNSTITDQDIAKIVNDCKKGNSGVITYSLADQFYLYYSPVGYQNLILLGEVPVKVASKTLLEIQVKTSNVAIICAVLIAVGVLAILVYRFIQANKKSVRELRYRNSMFDALAVSINDIFLMIDAKTYRADFMSNNLERLLGITHKDAMKDMRALEDSVVDKEGLDGFKDVKSMPIHTSRSLERQHMNLSTRELRWFRETVYKENIHGEEKYIIIMSDRTEEKEMNDRIQHALDTAKSANEAKSHFLSNMSHDIRTPMNAIVGFAVLLARDAENPEEVRKYTKKISASSQHLLSLINDVLDMSKIESGKTSLDVSEFKLPQLLEEIYTIVLPQAKAKSQSFEIYADGKLPELLLGDKLHLNQILLNMLSNAVKYTPLGGKIGFTVKKLPKTSPQCVNIRFIIKDNGYGMTPEFVKKIFDPFAREVTHATAGIQGTGLGMAITKNLIDLMGGTIEVDSEIDKGSTFTLDLSFAIPNTNIEEDTKFWEHRGIVRVLVADDDEDVRINIKTLLGEAGLTVDCVEDGEKAVEKALKAHSRKNDYNVIILDWKMPIMTGVEAAKKIRETIKKDVPILVLSSYDWSDIEQEAKEAGIDAFISKPFFVSAFKKTLQELDDQPKTVEEQEGENTLNGLNFLIAEDNELNVEILTELLDMEGAKFTVTNNGKQALETFVNSKDNEFDMVLMDIQMPIMDGYEAARQIRASSHNRAKDIPIIAMTANAFAEDVHNALKAGMTAHVAKPVDMKVVKSVIAKIKSGEIKVKND